MVVCRRCCGEVCLAIWAVADVAVGEAAVSEEVVSVAEALAEVLAEVLGEVLAEEGTSAAEAQVEAGRAVKSWLRQ